MTMICESKLRVILILILVLIVPSVGQNPRPAYLQGMQEVIAGGTTPESVTPPKIEGLKQLGTRRLRLINVDVNALRAVAADGTPTVEWPVTLTYPLKLCRQNH